MFGRDRAKDRHSPLLGEKKAVITDPLDQVPDFVPSLLQAWPRCLQCPKPQTCPFKTCILTRFPGDSSVRKRDRGAGGSTALVSLVKAIGNSHLPHCGEIWAHCQGQGHLGSAHSQCPRSWEVFAGHPRIHFPLFSSNSPLLGDQGRPACNTWGLGVWRP